MNDAETGSAFQIVEAATGKTWLPTVKSLMNG